LYGCRVHRRVFAVLLIFNREQLVNNFFLKKACLTSLFSI
jgi:hypothetical protein